MAYRFEKNYTSGNDIVIDGWEKGIAPSPLTGLQDVRNVNVEDIPGVAYPQPIPTLDTVDANGTNIFNQSRTFTANTGTEIITLSSALNSTNYIAVTFSNSGGSLPTISGGGLTAGVIYYLVFQTTTTFKIATTIQNAVAGTTADITGAGSGTNTVTVVNIGNITSSATDPGTGIIWAVDSNGYVWAKGYTGQTQGWILVTGNTTTQASGNGIAVFQNYLFVFRNAKIDVYGKLSGAISTHAWSNDWQSLNSTTSYTHRHETIVAQNNILYWCDFSDSSSTTQQGYIGSLNVTTGSVFVPGTSSTYTYNNQALDFPSFEEPTALEELNSNLVIAVNYYNNVSAKGGSRVYTWDTVSASFNYPVEISETPITDILNLNNLIYIFCGIRGRVYVTNMANVELAFKVPDHLFQYNSGTTDTNNYEGMILNFGAATGMVFSYGSCVVRKKMFFGVSFFGGSALYSYNGTTKSLKIEGLPTKGYSSSQNSVTDTTVINYVAPNSISTSYTDGTDLIYFWKNTDSSNVLSYGVDLFDITRSQNGNYNSLLISDLIPVGTFNNKKTFQQLEWKSFSPLKSSDGIKIYYRTNFSTAYTLLTNDTGSSFLSKTSNLIQFPLKDVQFLQIKIEITNFFQLKEIRIR